MKPRSFLRSVLLPAVVGVMSVSVAWAGSSLIPVSVPSEPPVRHAATEVPHLAPRSATSATADGAPGGPETQPFLDPGAVALPAEALHDGWYHVGAGKVSIYPRPDDYGGTWQTDTAACDTLTEDGFAALFGSPPDSFDHLASADSPWPENPDCIYVGGYGLGPMNSVRDFDTTYGLWARSVVISDGTTPLVLTQLDGEGWFWDYASKCDDCGWKQIGARLADELGTAPASFIFHATHSHTAPDFIGGWGFVPDWYMQQVVDSIEESVRRAVDTMRPARLEIGEVLARDLNRERRDTYHAPEEPGMTWLRAFVPTDDSQAPPHAAHPDARPVGRTIATIGTYAAHPTTVDVDGDVAHPDYPGLFAARVEERFGGVGMHLMTGLGNMSTGKGLATGTHLADRVPILGSGELVTSTSIRTAEHIWDQPTTNVPLTALGSPGFFDRQFNPTPAYVSVGPGLYDNPRSPDAPDEFGEPGQQFEAAARALFGHVPEPVGNCTSASLTSVEVVARAAVVGDALLVTSGPGELFSNSTNTIKEKAAEPRQLHAMPIAQANDALGYLPESFEASQNPASGQGAGFAESGPLFIEYEDAYAIDRCFGDANLEYTLELLDGLFGE